MLRTFIFLGLLWIGLNTVLAQSDKLKALETRADTLLNHEDFKGALKLYNKILKATKAKDKFYYGIVYKSAVSQYSLGNFDEALHQLNEFIPAQPEFPQARMLKAFIYREKDDVDNQLKEITVLARLQPDNPEWKKWRGMLYLNQEKFDSAKTELTQAKTIQDDAELETYLAFVYYNVEQADSALISLNKAIELDAGYQPAYLYAASFCLQEEEYELALTYLNLLLRLDPKNTTALFYKGIALVELKKTDEGCRCLAKAFYNGEDDATEYLKQYCYDPEN